MPGGAEPGLLETGFGAAAGAADRPGGLSVGFVTFAFALGIFTFISAFSEHSFIYKYIKY